MAELNEEIRKEHLNWVRRRLEALDKIEDKLKEMRELAVYAASRTLNEQETAQVQAWINILRSEVNELDKATGWVQRNSPQH